jgi:5-methylcytosine-specific restriction protein B
MKTFKGIEITKEKVLNALEKYDEVYPDTSKYDNWLAKDSYKYILEYNGKIYPPKYIMSLIINKDLSDFQSVPEINQIMEDLGFKIEDKSKGLQTLEKNTNNHIGVLKSEENFVGSINETYENLRKEGRIEFITFHPSYSYEEFIEGITVVTEKEDIPCENIQYILKPGIFKNICKRAFATAINLDLTQNLSWAEVYDQYLEMVEKGVDPKTLFKSAPKFVLIIDEINRGDIAKIFGELITLIEEDKRIGADNQIIVKLPNSGDDFGVPPNLYIIATMNTADRSIALLDIALRRRFGFIEMKPDFDLFRKEYLEKNIITFTENKVYESLALSIDKIEIVNKKISADKSIGIDRQIGHSFFFKIKNPEDLIIVWKYEILPLLEEYCYGDYSKINRILFNQETDSDWISESEGIKDILSMEDLKKMLDKIKTPE